jgi:hypothetical protein
LNRAAALRAETNCFLLAHSPAVGQQGFDGVIRPSHSHRLLAPIRRTPIRRSRCWGSNFTAGSDGSFEAFFGTACNSVGLEGIEISQDLRTTLH